jgi:hypothetical protein
MQPAGRQTASSRVAECVSGTFKTIYLKGTHFFVSRRGKMPREERECSGDGQA